MKKLFPKKQTDVRPRPLQEILHSFNQTIGELELLVKETEENMENNRQEIEFLTVRNGAMQVDVNRATIVRENLSRMIGL